MLSPETRSRDFPSLANRAYLNTAAEGVPPPAVARALAQYAADKELGMDGRVPHAHEWNALRDRAGQMLSLNADEIGICSCSSEAFNLAAMALQARWGDRGGEVVINDLDFPAGATPWLQTSTPFTARLWRSRDGALRVDDLAPLLTPSTRLVTLSLVSFFNGFRLHLPAVVEAVRRHSNALIAVDVTQALGRIPLDLRGADLVVSSTHKWILGSHGGGIVGVPRARAEEWTVPAGGWFHLHDAFGPNRFDGAQSKAGAASFSVGMPNYPAVYATRAAMDYIIGVGVNNIDQFCRPLVEHCLSELRRLPIDLLTPNEPDHLAGIISFRHADAERVRQHLHQHGVHVMSAVGRLRVAMHGYNTLADVDRFLSALREVIS